jgi:ABC-type transport system substrate-binding protein
MRLKDPKIDAALEEGRTNPDQAARKAAYDKVWQRFAADVPYAWLAHARISVMWSGKVHGVGEGTLPDGTKPLLFRGAIPTLIPLAGIWLGQ